MDPVYSTFLSVEVSSVNHGRSEVRVHLWVLNQSIHALIGSGSTYVYGYCDATYREGWGRDETVNFVKNSVFFSIFRLVLLTERLKSALALAMSRDGSSGGVIRMCVITEDSVERLFVPGNELPKFWEGHEVLGAPILQTFKAKKIDDVPMAVEA